MRRIVHLDMDAFYASVEQRDDARLRGKPVVVGGRPESRGVVAAASYEARAFGVRSAMPMARALRLCPDLVVVPPDFERYRRVSQQVMEILRACTPLVEPLSLDEAYLDVTENSWGEPLGMEVAKRLKRQIVADTGLTAAAGVAPSARRAEQIPRQDRLGLPQARRPDRDRAGAGGELPARASRGGALGRRPRHREKAPSRRHQTPYRRAHRGHGGAARGRRQPRRLAAA